MQLKPPAPTTLAGWTGTDNAGHGTVFTSLAAKLNNRFDLSSTGKFKF